MKFKEITIKQGNQLIAKYVNSDFTAQSNPNKLPIGTITNGQGMVRLSAISFTHMNDKELTFTATNDNVGQTVTVRCTL